MQQFTDKLDEWGPMTALILIAATLLIGGGVIVCILNPDTYSFAQLLNDLSRFVVGAGGVAIGRGIHSAARASSPSFTADLADEDGAHDHPGETKPLSKGRRS